MSRIQDILARAERDGTTRRPTAVPNASTAPAPHDLIAEADERVGVATLTAPPLQERRTAVPTLHPRLLAALAPHSAAAEEFRTIRTRLTHREEDGPLRTLLVTSARAGGGTSITAANLAIAMAQELHRQVVLVDTDMRTPAQHRLFGVDGTPGLAEVLSGEATIEEALVYLPDLRLTLLPAGARPTFPTELLASTAMRRALDALHARFDRVLLDAPAATPLADTSALAPLIDGALIVVRTGVTTRPALEEALAAFEPRQVVGVVLNDASARG